MYETYSERVRDILLRDFFILFDVMVSSFKEIQRRIITLHNFINRDLTFLVLFVEFLTSKAQKEASEILPLPSVLQI